MAKKTNAQESNRREFHFISGSSGKFWAIELKGKSFDVNFGKIGTAGQTKTKDFATEEKSKAAYDKLVAEKTGKGYVEITGAGSEGSANEGQLSPMDFSTTKDGDDIGSLAMFVGKRVVDYEDEDSIKTGDGYAYRIRVEYDDGVSVFTDRLEGLASSSAASDLTGLVIGNWMYEFDANAEALVEKLVKLKDKFPNLTGIFVGDIAQEEQEISWIKQADLSPLLAAFPKLELLRSRGADGLEFNQLKHKKLRALALESGGLGRSVVSQVCKGNLPNLEYLELWLGVENYGGDCRANDLQPILAGKRFPKLKYLGLRNSEIADELAGVLVNSPIVKQIETLDLSLGTLTDEGANALLNLPTDGNLKTLDVHHHFMSPTMTKKLKSLPFTVLANERQTEEDWGDGETFRFTAVSE